MKEPNKNGKIKNNLNIYPGILLQMLGALLGGIWIANTFIGSIWPEVDQTVSRGPKIESNIKVSNFPSKGVKVLVIGVDVDELDEANNKNAKGYQADSISILYFVPKKSVRILQIPIELGIQIPGNQSIVKISSLLGTGGPAMVLDVITEILGLYESPPERYILIPRSSIRNIVDELGELKINLDKEFKSDYDVDGYSINIPRGNNNLNGAQVEQLMRYRESPYDESQRRDRERLILSTMAKQASEYNLNGRLLYLLQDLLIEVETNLTEDELIILASIGLNSKSPPIFDQIPLEPIVGKQTIRQIKTNLTKPIWP